MQSRDYRDMVGGLILVAIGASEAIYAYAAYPIGTLGRMGPGIFPMLLGGLLTLLGLAIFVPAPFRQGELAMPEIGPAVAILVGALLFGLLVERCGLAPAIMAAVLVASLGAHKLGPVSMLVFAALMAIFGVLVFIIALRLPLAIVRWPF